MCQIANDATNQQYQGEQGWLTQFDSCCTLTYACFLLFTGVCVYIIRRRTSKNSELAHDVHGGGGGGTTHEEGSRESSDVSNDYQREPSSQHEEQREPNHIKATWTFY